MTVKIKTRHLADKDVGDGMMTRMYLADVRKDLEVENNTSGDMSYGDMLELAVHAADVLNDAVRYMSLVPRSDDDFGYDLGDKSHWSLVADIAQEVQTRAFHLGCRVDEARDAQKAWDGYRRDFETARREFRRIIDTRIIPLQGYQVIINPDEPPRVEPAKDRRLDEPVHVGGATV